MTLTSYLGPGWAELPPFTNQQLSMMDTALSVIQCEMAAISVMLRTTNCDTITLPASLTSRADPPKSTARSKLDARF